MDDASFAKYRVRLDDEMPTNLKTVLDYYYADMSTFEYDEPIKLAFDALAAWLRIKEEE